MWDNDPFGRWLAFKIPPPPPQNVAEFCKLNLKGDLWNTKHVELSKWEWDNVLEVALLYMFPFTQTANRVDENEISKYNHYTVEPRYNEVLGTMKITLLYQVSHYIRVKKQRNIKSWDQQNDLVIRGFCYIRPLYNEVPLYYMLDKWYYQTIILTNYVM